MRCIPESARNTKHFLFLFPAESQSSLNVGPYALKRSEIV